MEKIIVGNIDWLRNDYRINIVLGGITFPTLEHAYQASKTNDREIRQQIAETESVREARKIVRSLKKRDNFNGEEIMKLLIRQKFEAISLSEMLVKTGGLPIVMEGYDEFWGTGRSGEGQNMMGELLQDLRSDLQFIYGIDPDESKSDEEEVPTLEQALLKFGVDEVLANVCQDLFLGAKAVMSLVDANDYNAAYIASKTGKELSLIEDAIRKVKNFAETITKVEELLESPSDEASSDEDEDDDEDDDEEFDFDSSNMD